MNGTDGVERRPRVGLACDPRIRPRYLGAADLARLETFADVVQADFTVKSSHLSEPPPVEPVATAELAGFAAGLDALVVCHGAPRVTEAVLAAAPSLRVVGDLEGDRFGARVDIDAAPRARRRGGRHHARFVLPGGGVGPGAHGARPARRRPVGAPHRADGQDGSG